MCWPYHTNLPYVMAVRQVHMVIHTFRFAFEGLIQYRIVFRIEPYLTNLPCIMAVRWAPMEIQIFRFVSCFAAGFADKLSHTFPPACPAYYE